MMLVLRDWNPSVVSGCVGIALGHLLHRGLFIHGEWHVQAPQVVLAHIGVFTLIPALSYLYRSSEAGYAFDALGYMTYGYLTGLSISVLLYRTVFHPLIKAGFSGPWYAGISKLWHVWACRNSKNYLVLTDLHAKYGDFVRTGPSEITVFHPDIFMTVDGPRSDCTKAEFYDLIYPSMSIITSRNKAVHTARRREWSRGFSSKAIEQHETRMLRYLDQLDQCIEADAYAHRISDIRNLLFWFSFDVMGDFTFSKSFDMLQNRGWNSVIVRLQRAISLLGPVAPAPWLFHTAQRLVPNLGLVKDWHNMLSWCKEQMANRLQNSKDTPLLDLTHYLMETGGQGTSMDSAKWMLGDSVFAIVAGSEPTAVALINVFNELTKHPEHIDKIYEEVADVDVLDLKTLIRLPHLNAVINETLRLYPALFTMGNRKTSEKALTFRGRLIPPYTTIVTPRYCIARREDCFEKAVDFIPERWTTRPEMIRNMAAFAPFGSGSYACLGRTLALDMMRYTISRIIKKYRFRVAPNEPGARLVDDFRDQFTANPGSLSVFFELR